MKAQIPSDHYQLYKNIYGYINETVSAGIPDFGSSALSREVLDNYKTIDEVKGKGNSEFSIDILREKVASCQKCELSKRRKSSISFGCNKSVKIMVLLDIPDFYDEMQGRYFSDRSGDLLIKILKALGLGVENVYVTSTIKCVSVKEIDKVEPYLCCKNYLDIELSYHPFQLIIAFGELSYKMLFNSDNFEENRGSLLHYSNIPVVFTYHPREMIINPIYKKSAWDDLRPQISLITKIIS